MAGRFLPSKWLFLRELKCYAIGVYKDGGWHCFIPMCYASPDVIKKAGEHIHNKTIAIECVIDADERDYLKVVPGNPVDFEITYPQRAEFVGWDTALQEAHPGKIVISGQTVYGSTPFGLVWTPVRPDMGAVDLYETNVGSDFHKAVGKNLFGDFRDEK